MAGDPTLVAVRPPFFDNPTTRGLFDARTRAYWSVDSFGANVPRAAEDAADLDRAVWREGVLLVNRLKHPWHLLRRVPDVPTWTEPGQDFLDAVIATAAAEPAPV